MSLDATHSRLTKVGRIVIEGGHVLVEGFEGDDCSCRDVVVLACMHGMEVLALEARKTIEKPGGATDCGGVTAMLYTAENARGAAVIDVDTGERFSRVLEVSTSGGWIKVNDYPIRFDAQGRITGRRIHFHSVYAIQGLERMPCLFHCYGRQPAEAA